MSFTLLTRCTICISTRHCRSLPLGDLLETHLCTRRYVGTDCRNDYRFNPSGGKVYYSNVGDVSSSTFKYLFYDMNWLFFCGWMFLFCIVVVIAVSMFTAAPSAEKIQGLVFGTSTPEQKAATRASWNKWDIIHTLIILGITAAFIGISGKSVCCMIYIHAAYPLNKN